MISIMFAAKSSTLCVLLYASLVAADVITVYTKEKKYNKKTELQSVNIYNSLMTTVTCDELSNVESIRKCKVTLTTLDSGSESRACEFALDKNLNPPSGHPFTSNKAILMFETKKSSDDVYVKYTIVNLYDCKTAESKFNFQDFRLADANFDENQDAILLNEDDTFDVLYSDAKSCSKRLCLRKINAQGQEVMGSADSFAPIVPVFGSYRLVKKIPSSTNFIVTELKYGGPYKISLIKHDKQVVLKEYGTFDDWMDHSVSTFNSLIRICSKTNTTKVDCELLNDNGQTTSKISVDARQKVGIVAVQDLANGEFLLLVENEETGVLIRVKGDGSVIGVAKLSRFNRGRYFEYESYIDVSNKHYCVTRAGHGHGNLKVLKECCSDSDFK